MPREPFLAVHDFLTLQVYLPNSICLVTFKLVDELEAPISLDAGRSSQEFSFALEA